MSTQGLTRIARLLAAFAITAVALLSIGALTSGITPTTQAECLHRTDCNIHYPQVYCTDHHYYANICVAQAACQYDCCDVGIDPNCGDPE